MKYYGDGHVVNVEADYVTVSGFTLRDSGESDLGHMNSGVRIFYNNKAVIKNNVITNNKIGVAIWHGANYEISNNIINNNNDDLITWEDILLLVDKWDSNNVPLKEDLDLNGVVDLNDLAFYEDWSTDSNNSPPILGSIEDQYISVGNELSFSVSAIDNDVDELVYKALGLPEGAECSGQVFIWTPEQTGTYRITFIVSDYKSFDYITVKIIVHE